MGVLLAEIGDERLVLSAVCCVLRRSVVCPIGLDKLGAAPYFRVTGWPPAPQLLLSTPHSARGARPGYFRSASIRSKTALTVGEVGSPRICATASPNAVM